MGMGGSRELSNGHENEVEVKVGERSTDLQPHLILLADNCIKSHHVCVCMRMISLSTFFNIYLAFKCVSLYNIIYHISQMKNCGLQ